MPSPLRYGHNNTVSGFKLIFEHYAPGNLFHLSHSFGSDARVKIISVYTSVYFVSSVFSVSWSVAIPLLVHPFVSFQTQQHPKQQLLPTLNSGAYLGLINFIVFCGLFFYKLVLIEP